MRGPRQGPDKNVMINITKIDYKTDGGWEVRVQGVGSTGPDMAVSQSKEAIFQENFSILMLIILQTTIALA